MCSLTLKKLVVFTELEKELVSVVIADKMQVRAVHPGCLCRPGDGGTATPPALCPGCLTWRRVLALWHGWTPHNQGAVLSA